jgi:hypothetical protein
MTGLYACQGEIGLLAADILPALEEKVRLPGIAPGGGIKPPLAYAS